MSFPFSRTLSAGTHQLATTDVNILVDTSAGAVNLLLPPISDVISLSGNQGYSVGNLVNSFLTISDISGNAAANNITITPNGSNSFSNGLSTITINTNYGSASIKPTSDNYWNALFSQGSGGGGGIPTLQQVLDFNHDLVNGNFQGTGAGVGNTGSEIIALGTNAAFSNSGNYVTAIGSYSAYCNTGGNVIAIGSYSAYCNTGNGVTASGYRSAYCNTGDKGVSSFGNYSAYCNSGNSIVAVGSGSGYCNAGNFLTASGYYSGNCNSGNDVVGIGNKSGNCNSGNCVVAIGTRSAYCNQGNLVTGIGSNSASYQGGNIVYAIGDSAAQFNQGNNVIAVGYNSARNACACNSIYLGTSSGYDSGSGLGNTLNQSVVIANTELPSFVDATAAATAITIGNGAVANNTYLYYDQTTNSIGAVRL